MSKNLALQALQKAVADKSNRAHTLPKGFLKLFALFRDATNEAFPDGTFTAPSVVSWAGEYQRLGGIQVPDVFFNTYALGKLLKSHQGTLGIQFVGTYGNRAVYSVLQEKSNG